MNKNQATSTAKERTKIEKPLHSGASKSKRSYYSAQTELLERIKRSFSGSRYGSVEITDTVKDTKNGHDSSIPGGYRSHATDQRILALKDEYQALMQSINTLSDKFSKLNNKISRENGYGFTLEYLDQVTDTMPNNDKMRVSSVDSDYSKLKVRMQYPASLFPATVKQFPNNDASKKSFINQYEIEKGRINADVLAELKPYFDMGEYWQEMGFSGAYVSIEKTSSRFVILELVIWNG